jgi:catechol 2,3-dioxygenase-like lactoylglutathione lyase family enzyme
MIDHVSIPVSRLAESAEFYERVLATIGLKRLVDRRSTVGFGKKYPEFWLNARPGMTPAADDTGSHVCLRAPSADAVKAFHETALAAGGRDAGAPGLRKASVTIYFGAFIFDPDGNKIEAVTFARD